MTQGSNDLNNKPPQVLCLLISNTTIYGPFKMVKYLSYYKVSFYQVPLRYLHHNRFPPVIQILLHLISCTESVPAESLPPCTFPV